MRIKQTADHSVREQNSNSILLTPNTCSLPLSTRSPDLDKKDIGSIQTPDSCWRFERWIISNWLGNSRVVQRLRLHTSIAEGTGSNPGMGTKILHAAKHKQTKRKKYIYIYIYTHTHTYFQWPTSKTSQFDGRARQIRVHAGLSSLHILHHSPYLFHLPFCCSLKAKQNQNLHYILFPVVSLLFLLIPSLLQLIYLLPKAKESIQVKKSFHSPQ